MGASRRPPRLASQAPTAALVRSRSATSSAGRSRGSATADRAGSTG
ncbi:MAG: hypothetical protein IPO09_14840 [Anaeromyxobacter sp.]|nr:hypothetical protein [Anaeromyxobacter sp.]MBL0277127.1 hypothetical protein [Anaeromyxobacter sp.]